LRLLFATRGAGPFAPAKFKDHYQENLRALIQAKIQGKEVTERAAQPALVPVVDILAALKASLARRKQPQPAISQERTAGPNRRRRSRVIA
jgi:DNA end-binding protein Ku